MAPNNQVEISIDCSKMNELMTKFGHPFQSHEAGAKNSQRQLLHEKLVGERKVVNPRVLDAVKKGTVDNFVHVLGQVCEDEKLSLSDIFDSVTCTGDSLVHVAAQLGREEILMLICEHFNDLLTKRNTRGDTSLHVAARANKHTIVKFIISQHDGVKDEKITREINEHENTPLHVAVLCENVDAVKELIHADPEVVHSLNKSKQSPLYLAVVKGDQKILDHLLEIPFPKELPCCLGNSPLHAAILEQKPDLIRQILAKKPELVYLKDENGSTPLHYAAYIGYAEGFDILLQNSLNTSDVTPLEENKKGHLPIHVACKRGHVEVVRKFFQHEWHFKPFDLLNRKGQNTLHVAANNGKLKVVQYLLEIHPKSDDDQFINLKDNKGNTPLHLASKNLFPRVLYILARHNNTKKHLQNDQGLTAGDIVEKEKMSIRKFISSRILKEAGVPLKANKVLYSQDEKAEPKKEFSLKGFLDSFLVAATLMVTVTFAAAFTVPGGVYGSGDPNEGMAIFAHKPFFWVFTTFNMVAMYSSVIACGLMLMALIFDDKLATRAIILAMGCLVFTFLLVPVAFMAAVRLVVANNSALAIVITVIGTMYTSLILFSLVGFIPIGNHRPPIRQIGRFLLWVLVKSIGYDLKPPKPQVSSSQEPTKDNNNDKNKDNQSKEHVE